MNSEKSQKDRKLPSPEANVCQRILGRIAPSLISGAVSFADSASTSVPFGDLHENTDTGVPARDDGG